MAVVTEGPVSALHEAAGASELGCSATLARVLLAEKVASGLQAARGPWSAAEVPTRRPPQERPAAWHSCAPLSAWRSGRRHCRSRPGL